MFKKVKKFKNISDEFAVAVFVGKQTDGGNHAGFLVKNRDKTSIYHLLWHFKLKNDSIDTLTKKKYYKLVRWSEVKELTLQYDKSGARCMAVVLFLETAFEAGEHSVPYGINFSKTEFSPNGNINFGLGEHGLTCSTFVVCLLASKNVQLINLQSWPPPKPEDYKFREEIIEEMKKEKKISAVHINNIVNEPFNYRIRPEEVIAAANCTSLPASYAYCASLGEKFNEIKPCFLSNL